MNQDNVKFLVIRFSSIGDIVLTTPVLRGLKQQVKNAEVHFFTKPQYAFLMESNPYVDKVHRLKKIKQSVAELRDEKFDYIIDLHNNIRTFRFKNKLKVMDFSYSKLNWEKWLLVNFKINKLPDKHIVDRYMETVSVFDVNRDFKGLDYFVPSQDMIDIKQISSKLASANFVVFGIGGQHFTKKLPQENILKICKNISFPVVLVGGKDDEVVAGFVSSNTKNVFNLCGKLNLNQSASIVEQARLVITHDTGIMHIASALKKNILSIWGSTVPEFGMYPYMSGEGSELFEIKNLKCRPCSKIGYKSCPKNHFKCMKNQNADEIVKSAEKLLSINEKEV